MRAAWLARLTTLPVARVLPLLYPRLLPLHRLPAGDGGTQEGGPLPAALGGLTAERLESDGVYLLENGFEALLHCEPGAPAALVQALFGASRALCSLRASHMHFCPSLLTDLLRLPTLQVIGPDARASIPLI